MIVCSSYAELALFLERNPKEYAFVPTMGNLHAGHLSLIDTAKQYARHVIVSIFINPVQFGASEDFSIYPRTVDADLDLLRAKDIDMVYVPQINDIYPNTSKMFFDIPHLTQCLCGKSRPHFFNGVILVLLKLYLQIMPKYIVLGEKDYQQYLVVCEMVKSLSLNTTILLSPIFRNQNGLALSSRNGYLSQKDLCRAEQINTVLQNAILSGLEKAVEYAQEYLLPIVDKIDYLEVRSTIDLAPYTHDSSTIYRLFFAGFISGTRLIDNFVIPTF